MIINRFFLMVAGAVALAGCGSSDGSPWPAHEPSGSGGSADGAGARGAGGKSGTSGDGGSGGAAGLPVTMPECAAGAPDFVECPSLDPDAVFVAAGSSSNQATSDKPIGTIGAGITTALATGRHRVVVCNATYRETLFFAGKVAGGLRIDGGYTCPSAGNAGWRRSTRTRPKVLAEKGPALWIQSVAETLAFRDMEFESPDAAEPGDSSITAMVTAAQNLRLERVSILAGRGANGMDGRTGTKGTDAPQNGIEQVGAAATCDTTPKSGGTALRETCWSAGGGSGDPSGLGATTSRSSIGQSGASGAAGEPGSPEQTIGWFTGDEYHPARGSGGKDGRPGQGGDGGGASAGLKTTSLTCFGAGGGAGGMGGCGGIGGGGGDGGGASVALLVWDSAVTLTACTLTTSPGGKGGKGAVGGVGGSGANGSAGGAPLTSQGIASGGAGGPGGKGGVGGSGAGGTGGPSFPIVFHGRAIVWDEDTALLPSPGGEGGEGGAAFEKAIRGNDGLNGLSAATYEQK